MPQKKAQNNSSEVDQWPFHPGARCGFRKRRESRNASMMRASGSSQPWFSLNKPS